MVGVNTMARVNNFGVAADLVGVTPLIILLAVHSTRGPGIVFHTFGTGAGHTFGYFGVLLVASLTSAYVLYGFHPLARSYLREAFRAVASVQSGIAAELSLGIRWG
jgi:hypothetical protein